MLHTIHTSHYTQISRNAHMYTCPVGISLLSNGPEIFVRGKDRKRLNNGMRITTCMLILHVYHFPCPVSLSKCILLVLVYHSPSPLLLHHHKDIGAKGIWGGVAPGGHLLASGTLLVCSRHIQPLLQGAFLQSLSLNPFNHFFNHFLNPQRVIHFKSTHFFPPMFYFYTSFLLCVCLINICICIKY